MLVDDNMDDAEADRALCDHVGKITLNALDLVLEPRLQRKHAVMMAMELFELTRIFDNLAMGRTEPGRDKNADMLTVQDHNSPERVAMRKRYRDASGWPQEPSTEEIREMRDTADQILDLPRMNRLQ